ncbi:MAG: hypothetical protein ACKVHO_03555 [Verrucomicrobiia bacterium]|jgi:hypothetical protein
MKKLSKSGPPLHVSLLLLGLHAVLCVLPAWGAERLQGVFFNPLPSPPALRHWLADFHKTSKLVERELIELIDTTAINFVDIHLLMPTTLKHKGRAPSDDDATPTVWANLQTLDNLAAFVDLCHRHEVTVEIDLANHMWIPYSVNTSRHIGRSEWWPRPDSTPWTESRVWYTQIIEYVEARCAHPEAIAMWCMFGNYQLGAAESVLWGRTDPGTATSWGRRFVKEVWPAFKRAGNRPKAAPIMLPILVDDAGWNALPKRERLRAFTHLKRLLVDELQQPPDYWVMTTYPGCDPAKDGFRYLEEITRILGPSGSQRLISTDFKATGQKTGTTIVSQGGMSKADQLRWHFSKIDEYNLAGWWIWCYRDARGKQTGIRNERGQWKAELVNVIRQRCEQQRALNREANSK